MAGVEGLLVPSARVRGGVNIVIYPDNLEGGSEVKVWNEEELRGLK